MLAVLTVAASADVSAQLAYVQAANQVGQAWLFRKDGRCHALTPHHVVTAGDVIDLRASSAGAGELARARVIARWPQEDLALALVESGALKDCGPLLALPLDVASALRVDASGELRIVDNQGGIGVRAAKVVEMDDSTLTIRAPENLVKSLSGSVLFIGTMPAGMLLEVPNEGPLTGGGVMLRMDVATRLALDRLDAPASAAPSPRETSDRCGSGTVDRSDIAARANGGSIVSWTMLPESPEFGPENLLGEGCRAWQLRRPSVPCLRRHRPGRRRPGTAPRGRARCVSGGGTLRTGGGRSVHAPWHRWRVDVVGYGSLCRVEYSGDCCADQRGGGASHDQDLRWPQRRSAGAQPGSCEAGGDSVSDS